MNTTPENIKEKLDLAIQEAVTQYHEEHENQKNFHATVPLIWQP